jgi:DNA-binding response OmpR family regulator
MMSKAAQSKGWIAVVVEDGNNALSLMKSRNWNSIFISDDLPKLAGTQCIDEFWQ